VGGDRRFNLRTKEFYLGLFGGRAGKVRGEFARAPFLLPLFTKRAVPSSIQGEVSCDSVEVGTRGPGGLPVGTFLPNLEEGPLDDILCNVAIRCDAVRVTYE
jgi:hypothetical protein